MTKLTLPILLLLAACSSSERIPPVVYDEAKALCKPFQGMVDAQIEQSGWSYAGYGTHVKHNWYRIEAHCLGGQRVTHKVRINESGEIE